MLAGHTRRPTVGNDGGATGETFPLDGGIPQGCPSSPVIWCVVFAAAQAYVRATSREGYPVGNRRMSQQSYADDTALTATSKRGLQNTVQRFATALAVLSIRLNAAKSYYAASDGDGKETIEVYALDAAGRMRSSRCMPVPAQGLKPPAKSAKPEMTEAAHDDDSPPSGHTPRESAR